MANKKNKSQLTRNQVRRLYASFHGAKMSRVELEMLVKDRTDKVSDFLKPSLPWSRWYDLPYKSVLLSFLFVTGLLEGYLEVCKQPNFEELLIDFVEEDHDIPNEEELSAEEQAEIASLGIALFNQLFSFSVFCESVNSMVKRMNEGDDEALFDAVLIDRAVVTTPSVAKRIQLAELMGDNSFFDKLAKALTKTRRRPQQDKDDARYMIMALRDCASYAGHNTRELHEILANDLQLLPTEEDGDMKNKTDRGDNFKTFQKFLQRLPTPVNDI